MTSLWAALRTGRPRHESGIPIDTDADAIVTALQPLLCVAIVVICLVDVQPLGSHGWALIGTLLLAANGLLMFLRSLPDGLVPDRYRLWLALASAPLAGLMFGFDPDSWAQAFAWYLAVHAGIRFEAKIAAALAGLCSLTAAIVLAARQGQPHIPPSWLAGAIFLAVAFGMLRRSRRRLLATANELVVQSRKAAAAEVRTELARDLHDVLAHSLSGVNMQLSMADALFEAGRAEQGRAALKQAQGLVIEGLGEARRAVSMLRAGALDVEAALLAMANVPGETVSIVGDVAGLGDAGGQVVVRVAQESLTNARRHAPGAAIAMALAVEPDGSGRLDVVNAPAARRVDAGADGSGMGLVGMRERAASLGGTVTAGPETSGEYAGGWRVVLTLAPRGVDR